MEKQIKEMALGELVDALVRLKEEFLSKIVREDHPYPEIWDKYGGIPEYNKRISREYEQRHMDLIAELNKREQLFKKGPLK